MKQLALAMLLAACGQEHQDEGPPPTSTATDESFGAWVLALVEPMRARAIARAPEAERALLRTDKVRGVSVSMRFFGQHALQIRALVLRDGRVRYFGFGSYGTAHARAWPDRIAVGGLAEWDKYARFMIQHGDCAFPIATAEEWTEGTGGSSPYAPRRAMRTRCEAQEAMFRFPMATDRSISLTMFFEGGPSAADAVTITDDGSIAFVE